MWNGKPVAEWTLDEKNHFLTLLIGKCWHGKYTTDGYSSWKQCLACKEILPRYYSNPDYYHDLSGFQTVKDFMESQMAETWEKHLLFVASNVNTECKKRLQYKLYFTKVFNAQLSLDNLITYLLNGTEWAWKECPCPPEFQGDKEIVRICPYCGDLGKVKHPALTWAEELK